MWYILCVRKKDLRSSWFLIFHRTAIGNTSTFPCLHVCILFLMERAEFYGNFFSYIFSWCLCKLLIQNFFVQFYYKDFTGFYLSFYFFLSRFKIGCWRYRNFLFPGFHFFIKTMAVFSPRGYHFKYFIFHGHTLKLYPVWYFKVPVSYLKVP